MPLLELDHVQIAAPAGCEDVARTFYGGLLGLRELPKPPVLEARGGVWFGCGLGQLHVGVDPAFAPARKAHAALRTGSADDLRALATTLSAGGHPVTWDDAIPGLSRYYVDDPWGNRLELLAVD